MPTDEAKQNAGEECCLYWHWDAEGGLLYVGISLWPLLRMGAHHKGSPWSRQIASITIDWFPSRHDALEAEKRAIRDCAPLHNVQHNSTVRKRGHRPTAMIPSAVMRDILWREWEDKL